MSKRRQAFLGMTGLNKKSKNVSPWKEITLTPENADITDALSAIEYLRRIFPTLELGKRFPPIIFKHQLYTLLENRTQVDKEVNVLQDNGRIMVFHLGHRNEEYMIVLLSDFISYVYRYHKIPEPNGRTDKKEKNDHKLTREQEIISRFLIEIVNSVHDLSVNQQTLLEDHGFKDKDITELVKAGLLTVRDIGSWWFSIPGAGQFLKIFTKGRTMVIRMVRSTKYKEVLLSELKSRKTPASIKLGLLYHIHDLVGSDLVKCISTTSGMLLRIIDD